MEAPTIRRLGPDDMDVFRRIRLEALRAEPAAYSSSAADWEALRDEEWARRLAAACVFAAFDGDEPVGLMGLITQGASRMAHRATLVMVYVRKDRRGGGHATSLMQAVTRYALTLGIRQLELAVSAENPAAIRFYSRKGYREFGRIPAGFLHEGREIEKILMWRRIDGDAPSG